MQRWVNELEWQNLECTAQRHPFITPGRKIKDRAPRATTA